MPLGHDGHGRRQFVLSLYRSGENFFKLSLQKTVGRNVIIQRLLSRSIEWWSDNTHKIKDRHHYDIIMFTSDSCTTQELMGKFLLSLYYIWLLLPESNDLCFCKTLFHLSQRFFLHKSVTYQGFLSMVIIWMYSRNILNVHQCVGLAKLLECLWFAEGCLGTSAHVL